MDCYLEIPLESKEDIPYEGKIAFWKIGVGEGGDCPMSLITPVNRPNSDQIDKEIRRIYFRRKEVSV